MVVALILFSSCENDSAELPPSGTQVVEVGIREYRFVNPSTLTSGRAVFRAVNEGRIPHQVILVSLPDSPGRSDSEGTGTSRLALVPVVLLPPRPPGRQSTFAVDLIAGRYALVCAIQAPDGQRHAEKGMNSEFRVA